MQQELNDQLRDAGLRVTSGRVALLEKLHDLPHSDAESLFQALKQTLPGLSVQSVHNVLGDLT
ncbi:MAG TPA: transcriptional repressor, partial [Terrimesophilobacter sp.]|nr:transcriptional repressor [Terrimesophilobacter sp.]